MFKSFNFEFTAIKNNVKEKDMVRICIFSKLLQQTAIFRFQYHSHLLNSSDIKIANIPPDQTI